MDGILAIVAPVFWGVVVFSLLVFVHEGGHFLAARACGVRVTEFFLGLPCRWRVYKQSKRIGTKFGVTPFLLGGYAAICGMDPDEAPHADRVLAAIHAHGTVDVNELAEELGITSEEALDAAAFLLTWGSIAPVYDVRKVEKPSGAFYPSTYAALPRDAAGNTLYDGKRFDRAHATGEGECWEYPGTPSEFLGHERARTYLGCGFLKRTAMLLAGIFVNIVTGFLLLMAVYSVIGVQAVDNSTVLGAVTDGGPAAQAGIVAGDTVSAIGDTAVDTWSDLVTALRAYEPGDTVEIAYEHDGVRSTADVRLSDEGTIGIRSSLITRRLDPISSAKVAAAYVVSTAEGIARLVQPAHTMEVLDQSTSVVGISVMSAEAAASGPATFLTFMAMISFSLGFMNLLPIPPLDGGKWFIEIIQVVLRRPVPTRAQMWVSYAGIALFGLLFIYLFRADILRLLG